MLKSTFFFTICATATAVTSANNIRAAATVIRWLHVAVVRPHNPADIIATAAADVILYNDTTGTPSSARHTFNVSVPGVSFSSLTFARFNIGSSTSAALNFNTGAHNASVTGCVFNDMLGTASFSSNAIRMGDCNGVSIIGNQFNDFYYNIYQSGNNGAVGSA